MLSPAEKYGYVSAVVFAKFRLGASVNKTKWGLISGIYLGLLLLLFFLLRPVAVGMLLLIPWLLPVGYFFSFRPLILAFEWHRNASGWVKFSGKARGEGTAVKNWDGKEVLAYVMRVW